MKGDNCTDLWVCRSDLKTITNFVTNLSNSD